MLSIKATSGYRKALKKLVGSGNFKLSELEYVIDLLADCQKLPVKYKDHALTGELKGFRECHVS
jgi:mRNA interferase YafQ